MKSKGISVCYKNNDERKKSDRNQTNVLPQYKVKIAISN